MRRLSLLVTPKPRPWLPSSHLRSSCGSSSTRLLLSAWPSSLSSFNGSPRASPLHTDVPRHQEILWKNLDFKFIKEHMAEVEQNVRSRKVEADVGRVIELYDKMQQQEHEAKTLRTQRNRIAAELKNGRTEELISQGPPPPKMNCAHSSSFLSAHRSTHQTYCAQENSFASSCRTWKKK